jgi:hypothetical protein
VPAGPGCATDTVAVKSHTVPDGSVSRRYGSANVSPRDLPAEPPLRFIPAMSIPSGYIPSNKLSTFTEPSSSSHLEYAPSVLVKETPHEEGERDRPNLLLDPFGLTTNGGAQGSASESLADEFIWEELCDSARGLKLVSLWWLPCLTFHFYRDKEGVGRYGARGVPPKCKEPVRLETLHCVRVSKLLTDLSKFGVPWAAAVPLHSEDQPTPFDLDEWLTLIRSVGAQVLRGTTAKCCPNSWESGTCSVLVVAFNLGHVQLQNEDLLEQVVFNLQEKVEDRRGISTTSRKSRRVGF